MNGQCTEVSEALFNMKVVNTCCYRLAQTHRIDPNVNYGPDTKDVSVWLIHCHKDTTPTVGI